MTTHKYYACLPGMKDRLIAKLTNRHAVLEIDVAAAEMRLQWMFERLAQTLRTSMIDQQGMPGHDYLFCRLAM